MVANSIESLNRRWLLPAHRSPPATLNPSPRNATRRYNSIIEILRTGDQVSATLS